MAKKLDPKAATDLCDRGWEQLEEDDHEGAVHSAESALKHRPDLVEAHTLLGAARWRGGDVEGAEGAFRAALELDEEDVPAILYLAELLLREASKALGDDGDAEDAAAVTGATEDVEEALELVERALDTAEEEGDAIDGMLLRAEALLVLEREPEAKDALAELPDGEYPDPDLHLRAGQLLLEVESLDAAEKQLRRALEENEDDADAWHAMGCVHEARGDEAKMIEAWLKVRALDLDAPAAPWSMTKEEFDAVAEAALGELPPRARELLGNVPILGADYPDTHVIEDGWDPRILGLFTGVPYPHKQSSTGTPPHLDTVMLYQRNIENACASRAEVEAQIRITVLHETGHFFGLEEDDLHAMGLG